MDRVVVDGFGKYIGRQDNRIVVKEEGRIIHEVVAENLRQVVISGSGSISFDAMNLLAENGVDLIVLNWKGSVSARLSCPEMRTVSTRREQYYAMNDERSGHIAKSIIYAKVKNQYALLGTWAKTRKETDTASAEKLMELRTQLNNLLDEIEKIKNAPSERIRDTLMGLEGRASALYWEGFGTLIPKEYEFSMREGAGKGSPRYAVDMVNAMLNYGYGILEGEVWRAVFFAGLDPYGGFLHVDRPGRPSMVLDMMEEFRQQIVDKTILALITKKVVNAGEYKMVDGLCRLEDSSRRNVLKNILEKFEEYMVYKEEKMRWCDLILRQARQIAKFLRKEIPSYDSFYLRW